MDWFGSWIITVPRSYAREGTVVAMFIVEDLMDIRRSMVFVMTMRGAFPKAKPPRP
jgi:hypothetical protein